MDTLRGGAIDDGQRIWLESKAAYDRGDWPVFAMAKEWKKGSHTVLPYRWNEFPDGTKEIWIADPSRPPLLRDPDDTADGLERIFVSADGAWTYQRKVDEVFSPVGSYNSATPRWLISIPMSCFTGQHTLPTVGAILDIVLDGLANWAAGIVVGGDVDTEQISDAAGRTLFRPDLDHLPSSPLDLRSDPDGFIPGLVPLPVFGGEDVPVEGEFFHAVGRHDLLAHDVVPRQAGGTYHWAMRQGPMAVSIAAPTDGHPDRIHAERLGSAARAVGFARGKTVPPKSIAMMVEAFPRSRCRRLRVGGRTADPAVPARGPHRRRRVTAWSPGRPTVATSCSCRRTARPPPSRSGCAGGRARRCRVCAASPWTRTGRRCSARRAGQWSRWTRRRSRWRCGSRRTGPGCGATRRSRRARPRRERRHSRRGPGSAYLRG